MGNFSLDDLNYEEFDTLVELGNIGIGNVATSLSTLLEKTINVSIPKVNTLDISEISDVLGGSEKRVAGVLFGMSQDIEGMMLFILEEKFAGDIVNILFKSDSANFDNLDEISISTLKEVANIMAGTYLNAISSMTDFRIELSVPYFTVDMLGAIMDIPAIQFGEIGNKILLVEEKIIEGGEGFNSYLMFVPTLDSIKKILDKVNGK